MEKNNKTLKILVVMLAVLLIAAIAYIVADKFVFNQTKRDNMNNVTEKCIKSQDSKVVSNDWNLFVSNVKKNKGKMNNSPEFVEHQTGGGEITEYTIKLSNDGTLSVDYNNKNYEIAKNVILYREHPHGSGGNYSLYHSAEDGSLYETRIQKYLLSNEPIKTEKINFAKEIVEILPVYGQDGPSSAFIDINGNVYTY